MAWPSALPQILSLPGAPPQVSRPTVVDSTESPEAYRTAQDVEVRYASQGNDQVAPADRVVLGPTRVLESSQRLLEGWRTAAGASPTLGVQTPQVHSQVENDNVQVNHTSSRPLVYLDGSDLEGDPNVTSPFVTANQVHDTVTSELGRAIRYRSEDGRLNVNVGAPDNGIGPHHTSGTGTITFPRSNDDGTTLATDPDVVAHEQGHAILDSQRPEMNKTPDSKATHEAFADGVAFFNALQQPEVREDTIRRWDDPNASQSGLAANVGEEVLTYFGERPQTPGEGVRDLSGQARPGTPEAIGPHESGLQFGTALHDATREAYLELRRSNPELTAEAAYTQATEGVRSDFYRALDFLPPGGEITRDDLAAAMMRANSIDNNGARSENYRRHFEEAGLRPVTPDRVAQEAGVRALADQVTLPANLQGQNYESQHHGQESTVRNQAEQFLQQNGARLGIPSSYVMQAGRVYSNDRGETFMLYSGTNPNNPDAPREMLSVGFDRDGRLIQFDSAQEQAAPTFTPPVFPPGGSTLPTPVPGGTGWPFPPFNVPNFPAPNSGGSTLPAPMPGGTGWPFPPSNVPNFPAPNSGGPSWTAPGTGNSGGFGTMPRGTTTFPPFGGSFNGNQTSQPPMFLGTF